jgi:hypothetical protein
MQAIFVEKWMKNRITSWGKWQQAWKARGLLRSFAHVNESEAIQVLEAGW